MRLISVLGSTGSIGVNTLDVIGRHPDQFQVFGLAANSSVDAMLAQCLAHRPQFAVMMNERAADELQAKMPPQFPTQ
jgi:1-deoxy-D-xylulose-5-phosphate reductoisomerase